MMSNLYSLSETQMQRIQPYFSKNRGLARMDDRRVLRGIIFINLNGLRWCDAPAEYGPSKTLYNRWKRWSDMSVFARIMMGWQSRPLTTRPSQSTAPISKHIVRPPACG